MRADTAPLPEISLVDLTKQYREVRAVDRVCLDIAIGEFFSLLGPSGCGKIEPVMAASGTERHTAGRVVIGTVKGDIHEIGKNLVGMMLAASGFDVHDLGVDVAPDRFADKAAEVGASIVGVSALLTTTMTGQRAVIEALEARGLRPAVKVLVGGAPVTDSWASQIGADGYSRDAVGAVAVAKRLVGAEA